MTVAEELENRGRCAYGLRGAMVAVDGDDEPIAVETWRWGDGGRLVLALVDGRAFPADRLELRSPWPVVCCEPRVANEWNRERNTSRPPGTRPPL